jgi:hypothetical protein
MVFMIHLSVGSKESAIWPQPWTRMTEKWLARLAQFHSTIPSVKEATSAPYAAPVIPRAAKHVIPREVAESIGQSCCCRITGQTGFCDYGH